MKDKFPALRPSLFFNSFLKKEKIVERNSSVIYNCYSFLFIVLRFAHFFFFLYFSRDHLRWRTICGSFWGLFGIWRSFAVLYRSTHSKSTRECGWLSFFILMNKPFSDQHQFSSNDIHRLSRDKVMRINKMITWWETCFDLLTNSLNTFFKEMYRDQFGEFVFVYWGLKG